MADPFGLGGQWPVMARPRVQCWLPGHGGKGKGGKGKGRGKEPLAAEGNWRKGQKPLGAVKSACTVCIPTPPVQRFWSMPVGPYHRIRQEVTLGKGKGPTGSRQRSNSFTISYGPKILLENWPFIDDVGDDDDDDIR